jgi:hypothetical protein
VRARRLYAGTRAQTLISILISANFVVNAAQATSWVRDDEKWKRILYGIDICFLIAFTVELVLNMWAHGRHVFLRASKWNLFDLVIILGSWPALFLYQVGEITLV